jgi:predicted RNase H-like nuclease
MPAKFETGAKSRVFCGIDGCRGGWVAVFLPQARPSRAWAKVYARWSDIPLGGIAIAAVDMPIGLPDSGPRGCDQRARELLGTARSRVFPHLRRKLLRFIGDWRAANEWAKHDGKGISKQAFNILPKIAEIDRWIAPRRQPRVREAHPELAFARLNGGAALASKATEAGLGARRRLLHKAGFARLDVLWRAVKAQGKAGGVKPDDLLDACVLALTARRIAAGRAVRLGGGARDARGLRMEIWY